MTFRLWILKRYLYFAIRKFLLMIFPSNTKQRFGAVRLFFGKRKTDQNSVSNRVF